MLSLNDVCQRLKLNRATVISFIEEGKLKASRLGKQYRITEEALEEFVESQQVVKAK